MKRTALLATLLSFSAVTHSQTGSRSSSDILHRMQMLNTAGTVLYLAAHPDDENTRLISYLANERLLRTAYLSLTHGEGGQNLIGSEQGEALGVLRTQELLAARRTDGGEQYFAGAADFGYSKNPGETLGKWDREKVLGEIVLIIRRLKPDVIVCRFPTTGEGGHGHHTASAMLALEAFDAAADKNKYPEQLTYFSTWQCRRVFWNTFNFSSGNTIGPGQYTLDVGGFNPLQGKSYGEIAAESRSMHKSQGFGAARQRGTSIEYFRLLKGDSTGNDLFSSIDLSLSRFTEFGKTSRMISECFDQFKPSEPHRSIPALAKVLRNLRSIKDDDAAVRHWKTRKIKECEDLMRDCAGLWTEITAPRSTSVEGEKLNLKVSVLNRSAAPAKLKHVSVGSVRFSPDVPLAANQTFTLSEAVEIKKTASRDNISFNYSAYAGKKAVPPHVAATFVIEIEGESILFEEDLIYKRSDPVKGEVVEPFYIIPPVDIRFNEDVYVINNEQKTIGIIIKANADNVKGVVRTSVTKGWKISSRDSAFEIGRAGEELSYTVSVSSGNEKKGELQAAAIVNGTLHNSSLEFLTYDHIPRQLIQRPASAKLADPSLKPGSVKIAYVEGAGDAVPACLKQAGYSVTTITEGQIATEKLRDYDAVVTGIRAFNVHDHLHKKMNVLLEFVKQGGNLIVQYNTNSRVGPLAFTPGPYPFTISRQRVTDEHANVEFHAPAHPALNSPNRIGPEDFEGWVQERGIYFAKDIDPKYQKILRMSDPGESPEDGSLIIAPYGKGNFVYTGLAFFRQLPAGVPGAYRLFANLLELPEAANHDRAD